MEKVTRAIAASPKKINAEVEPIAKIRTVSTQRLANVPNKTIEETSKSS